MNNYPPGVSGSTYGAPWNEEEEEREVEITLKANIIASFPGPAQINEYEVMEAIKEIVEEDLKKTSEDYEIVDITTVSKNTPYRVAVWWSVEDFAYIAEQEFERKKDKSEFKDFKTWRDYYDESKFPEALDRMIHKHDAEYGITWESVKYFLEEMCIKGEKEDEIN